MPRARVGEGRESQVPAGGWKVGREEKGGKDGVSEAGSVGGSICGAICAEERRDVGRRAELEAPIGDKWLNV